MVFYFSRDASNLKTNDTSMQFVRLSLTQVSFVSCPELASITLSISYFLRTPQAINLTPWP